MSSPSRGSLTLGSTEVGPDQTVDKADIGTLKFTPVANTSGANYASFTFQVQDDGLTQNGGVDFDPTSRTFTFNVTAINHAPVNTVPTTPQPVAEDTSLSFGTGISVVDQDTAATFILSSVKLSVEHGILTATPTGNATIMHDAVNPNKILTITGTQIDINTTLASLIYQGEQDYNGSDTLTVLSTDAGGLTDSDSVSITVTAVNDAPTANPDSTTVLQGSSGNAIDVLANDSRGPANESGQTLTVKEVSALNGNVSITGGTLSYTPNFGYSGIDTISYTITDDGNTNGTDDHKIANGTVKVTITPVVNHEPVNTVPTTPQSVAEDTSLSFGTGISVVDQDTAATFILSSVKLSVEHGTLTATPTGNATITRDAINPNKILTITGTQSDINTTLASLAYQGEPDYNGSDRLTVLSTDAGGLTDSDSVSITVTAVNDAPNAVPDTGSTVENATLTVPFASGVLSNDTDPDSNDTHTVSAVNGLAQNVGPGVIGTNGGIFTIQIDGSYSFNPGTAFDHLAAGATPLATTSVDYTNQDGHGSSSTSTLTITVNGIDNQVALQDIDINCQPAPDLIKYGYRLNTQIPDADKEITVHNVPGYVTYDFYDYNTADESCSTQPQLPIPSNGGCTVTNTNTNPSHYSCSGIDVAVPQGSVIPSSSKVQISGTPTTAGVSTFCLKVTAASDSSLTCTRKYQFHSTTDTGGWGDPHITTVDGVNYDFQSAGEFVALRGDGLEIQTRQTPIAQTIPPSLPEEYTKYTGISSCVSVYSAVAAKVGKHWVTYQPNYINDVQDFGSGMQLRVDGDLIDLTALGREGLCLDSDSTSAYPFSCGRVVKLPAGKGIEIHFPNKTRLVVTSEWWAGPNTWYLDLKVKDTAATEGIMGRTVDGWLPALSNGTSVGSRPEPTDQTPKAKAKALHDRYVALYETFADSWRVTDADDTKSHFYYDKEKGESTAKFTLKEWPRENPTTCDIAGKPVPLSAKSALATHSAQPKTLADAKIICKDITDENRKANCEFDVMATGYTGFAKSYLVSQKFEPGRTETKVTDDKDPTKYEESVTFTATVAPAASRNGEGNPAGSVQFVIDGIMAGSPVKLDATGRATWTTSNLLAFKHRIKANYIPSPGSTFKASTSPEQSHTVTATPMQWFWFFITAIVAVIGLLVRWFRQKQAG